MKSIAILIFFITISLVLGCSMNGDKPMSSQTDTNWPNNADGDVFRRLVNNGFDFTKKYSIDFNVDFQSWPPSKEAIAKLRSSYPNAKIIDSEDDYDGYLEFQIVDFLTYDLVIETQSKVSDLMKESGGTCNSWGVLQE